MEWVNNLQNWDHLEISSIMKQTKLLKTLRELQRNKVNKKTSTSDYGSGKQVTILGSFRDLQQYKIDYAT